MYLRDAPVAAGLRDSIVSATTKQNVKTNNVRSGIRPRIRAMSPDVSGSARSAMAERL